MSQDGMVMVADGAPSSKTSIRSFGITGLPLGNMCETEMSARGAIVGQPPSVALLPGEHAQLRLQPGPKSCLTTACLLAAIGVRENYSWRRAAARLVLAS
jgi:hypothetical protein